MAITGLGAIQLSRHGRAASAFTRGQRHLPGLAPDHAAWPLEAGAICQVVQDPVAAPSNPEADHRPFVVEVCGAPLEFNSAFPASARIRFLRVRNHAADVGESTSRGPGYPSSPRFSQRIVSARRPDVSAWCMCAERWSARVKADVSTLRRGVRVSTVRMGRFNRSISDI